jgi:hypothetical protein
VIPVALIYRSSRTGALGDGVVLSSINGRTETRTYAKFVRSGAGAPRPAGWHHVGYAGFGNLRRA